MIYSQFALFMLRVFGMVHQAAFKYYASNGAAAGSNMRTARIEGDIEIGALFPMHRKQPGDDSCGEIWEQYGIHRAEAALLTVDAINKKRLIAPAVRLGIDIRDDCWTERIAMEQSIEFIRDAMGQRPVLKCCPGQICNSDAAASPNVSSSTAPNLAAVVGPGSSDPSITIQNLLQVFRIPQVGYSATSVDLSDKVEFKYYMRVAPSDIWQAKALVDIVRSFNWTYIAAVYTAANYGEKGFQEFYKHIERDASDTLCLAVQEKIKSLSPPEDFDVLLNNILTAVPRPQVAVCFCEGETIKEIFKATKRLKEKQAFDSNITDIGIQWIGSDGWSDRRDVVNGVEEQAFGQLSLKIHSPRPPKHIFDDYYKSLTPYNNQRNPWFVEFWETKFECALRESTKNVYKKGLCLGNETLNDEKVSYEPDPKLSQVINSIYTVAYALAAMYNDTCGNYTDAENYGRLCPQMKPINGSTLFQYMLNVRFEDFSGQEIYFDSNGDPPAWYDILNYRGKGQGYRTVGEWRRVSSTSSNQNSSEKTIYETSLNIDRSDLVWYDGKSALDFIPTSICSSPCKIGEIKKIQAQQKCCWNCIRCQDNEFVLNEETCQMCPLGSWPTPDRSGCYDLEIEYLRWNSPEAVAAMVLALVGMCATLYTTVTFLRYNSTPVVKATTRELSYIILAGIFMCYGTTFVIVVKPNIVTCYLVRIVPGTAFAMIYGALLTKTNRIARILAGSKKRILTKKPRFMSTWAQVMITMLLVAVELSIIAAITIYEPPSAVNDFSIPKRNLLICKTTTLSFLAPFGFDFFLISLCTLYAVKTRNLPENFNEAKFIGFTMYTTFIIWLAFCTIYFGSNNKGITMCLSFILSATVGLALLFIPKLYIIVFQPEKNVRSSYATTKVIRCHFGTSPSNVSQTPSNRTSSSLKNSSVSRPSSSKFSNSRSGTDSGIESSLKIKKNLRESVHVPVHASTPTQPLSSSSTAPKTKIEVTTDSASSTPSSSGSSKSSTFRPSFYFPHHTARADFENELSVIEESLMSHDDSTTQSQGPATSAPGSVDQPTSTFANQVVQTDEALLEDYFREWCVRNRKTSTKSIEKQTSNLDVHAAGSKDARKNSGGGGEKLKRTFSDYKNNLKKKLAGKSKDVRKADKCDFDDDDPFQAMLAHHTFKPVEVNKNYNDKSRRRADESPLLNSDDGVKLKKFSSASNVRNGADLELTSSADELDDECKDKRRNNSSNGLGDLLAQGLGGSLKTMFGTAVPVEEDQQFYIRTEFLDYESDVETTEKSSKSLIGATLERSFGTIGAPLNFRGSTESPKEPVAQQLQQQLPRGSRCSDAGSEDSTPSQSQSQKSPMNLERKGSFFTRFGYSLKKKIRRFSMEHSNTDHSMSSRGSRESLGTDDAGKRLVHEYGSPCTSLANVQASTIGLIPEEVEILTPTPSPCKKRPKALRDESLESDSGIIVTNRRFEKAISLDSASCVKSEFDTDSSKHSSAKSKQNSVKKVRDKNVASPTIKVDADSGGGNSATVYDLEQIFYKQGMEPHDFSQSTLV